MLSDVNRFSRKSRQYLIHNLIPDLIRDLTPDLILDLIPDLNLDFIPDLIFNGFHQLDP
jgi:hypothetical protein